MEPEDIDVLTGQLRREGGQNAQLNTLSINGNDQRAVETRKG